MNLAFVVERPTQFEAPFYRFAAADPEHRLWVVFTGADPAAPVHDPELGRQVAWDMDLLSGYEHAVLPSLGQRAWLGRELARRGCGLLIVNGYTRRPYLAAVAAARRRGVATGLRLDSVLWPGSVGSGGHGMAKRLLFRLYLRRAFALFFAVGSLSRRYLRHFGIADERIGRFPYAVDVEEFRRRAAEAGGGRAARRRQLGFPEEAPVILALAKLNPREAPWDLLRAAAGMPEPRPWLAIAGDGPLRRELEGHARELGLSRVRFLGYVPYGGLPALYAACDLFVHAPREERWGVSVQEALACGLPVVAGSRVGAAHDLVAPGENGFLYPTGDARALAARLTDALALEPTRAHRRSRKILRRWDYAAAWRDILAAAERLEQTVGHRP